MYTGFESFTDDELIARLPGTGKLGEELAVRLEARQDQLQQAGKALTAARELQARVQDIEEAHDGAAYDFTRELPELIEQALAAVTAFGDADDGELGA